MVSSDDEKRIFRLLLEHADKTRLNELNPTWHNEGLIHRLIRPGMQWQMHQLLDHGADPKLLTGNHRRWSAMHSAVYRDALDLANILLERGADPTLVEKGGFDVALTAAYEGCVPSLTPRSFRILFLTRLLRRSLISIIFTYLRRGMKYRKGQRHDHSLSRLCGSTGC